MTDRSPLGHLVGTAADDTVPFHDHETSLDHRVSARANPRHRQRHWTELNDAATCTASHLDFARRLIALQRLHTLDDVVGEPLELARTRGSGAMRAEIAVAIADETLVGRGASRGVDVGAQTTTLLLDRLEEHVDALVERLLPEIRRLRLASPRRERCLIEWHEEDRRPGSAGNARFECDAIVDRRRRAAPEPVVQDDDGARTAADVGRGRSLRVRHRRIAHPDAARLVEPHAESIGEEPRRIALVLRAEDGRIVLRPGGGLDHRFDLERSRRLAAADLSWRASLGFT